MKPTWKLTCNPGRDSHNCQCLNYGKKFTFLEEGHFNMRLIKCPTCNQEVWVPRCPKGCLFFEKEETGDKEEDYERFYF